MGRDSAFLTSSPITLMLLVHGSHFSAEAIKERNQEKMETEGPLWLDKVLREGLLGGDV